MTDTTELPATSHPEHRVLRSDLRAVVRGELIKMYSLRSTVWLHAVTITTGVALAVLIALTTGDSVRSPAEQVTAALGAATFGVFFVQIAVAVLGVVTMTGEYSSRQILSTLTVVPRRLTVLWAKTIVVFVSASLSGFTSAVLAYVAASPILASKGVHSTIVDPDVVLPLLGTAFYLGVVAVFALGLGTVIRSTAGAVSASIGVLLLLPLAFALIPVTSINEAQVFLLNSAGLAIAGGPSTLDTWQQVLVTLAWPAVSVALGGLLLVRRDA